MTTSREEPKGSSAGPPLAAAATVFGLAALTVLLTVRGLTPPAPAGASAPAPSFSAQRAKAILEEIARQPRVPGTAPHRAAAEVLKGRLEALGLETQVQETVVLLEGREGRQLSGGPVSNVLGRLRGRGTSGAILVASHYDTVPGSPGAADDGAALAATLEALRALRQGPPLARDLIVLFSDGEESGLLGARAFAAEHPWAADVGLVLNFEARGSRGPLLMFETGSGNHRRVRELGRALPAARAYSFNYEIYRHLANDTDFTVFRKAGWKGFNFANIGGDESYHSAQDSIANLDPGTMQELGETMLRALRRFGELEAAAFDGPSGDGVFFSLAGWRLLSLPASWMAPLALVLALAVAWLTVGFVRRGRVRLRSVWHGFLGILLGSFFPGYFLESVVVHGFDSRGSFDLGGGWDSTELFLLAATLLAFGLGLSGAALLWRRLGFWNTALGGLWVFLGLAGLAAAIVPGTAYLFALPLAVAWTTLWSLERTSPLSPEESTRGAVLGQAALGVVLALLWAPLLLVLAAALGLAALLPLGLFLGLALGGLLGPASTWSVGPSLLASPRPWLPLVALAGALAAFGISRGASGFDDVDLEPLSLVYVLDAETGSAHWLSFDDGLNRLNRQVMTAAAEEAPTPDFLSYPRPSLRQSAPLPETAYDVEVKTEIRNGATEVSLEWPFAVHRALLEFSPAERVKVLEVEGREAPETRGRRDGDLRLEYLAPERRLSMLLALEGPVQVRLVAQRLELPPLAGGRRPHLPRGARPWRGWDSGSTFVVDRIRLAPGGGDLLPGAGGGEGTGAAGEGP